MRPAGLLDGAYWLIGPGWLKAAAAGFRCGPGRGRHIVAAARLPLVENYYTCKHLMKPLKALMISVSVGCICADQEIIHWSGNRIRDSSSASFRLPKIRCQSADPKDSADLSPQADESALHTSLTGSDKQLSELADINQHIMITHASCECWTSNYVKQRRCVPLLMTTLCTYPVANSGGNLAMVPSGK